MLMPNSMSSMAPSDPPKFVVRTASGKGRFVVCSRKILGGEVVLTDDPYVIVPTFELKNRICMSTFEINYLRYKQNNARIPKIVNETSGNKKYVPCMRCQTHFYATPEIAKKAQETIHTRFECDCLKMLYDLSQKKAPLKSTAIKLENYQYTDAYMLLAILVRRAKEIHAKRKALENADPSSNVNSIESEHSYSDVRDLVTNRQSMPEQNIKAKLNTVKVVHEIVKYQIELRQQRKQKLMAKKATRAQQQQQQTQQQSENNNNDSSSCHHQDQPDSPPSPPRQAPPRTNSEEFVDYLLEDMTEDEMVSLLCINDCNAFGFWDSEGSVYGVGIYPRASFFNHSCYPNLAKWFEGGKLYIVALRDIDPGEELNITYIELDSSRELRVSRLKSYYYFECSCARCTADKLAASKADEDTSFVRQFVCKDGTCCGLMIPVCDPSSSAAIGNNVCCLPTRKFLVPSAPLPKRVCNICFFTED